MSEVKGVSFRLGEEDIQKFREFAEEQGMNQAEMFQAMINSFEISKAKSNISDRAKEIETFQATINTLTGMFVNSLAVNQTSEERIREELSVELTTKNKTIADLQTREQILKTKFDDAKSELTRCTDRLHSAYVRIEKQDEEIAQKNNVIKTQQEQIETLNAIVADGKGHKEENKELKARNAELNEEVIVMQNEISAYVSKTQNLEEMRIFYLQQIESLKDELKEARDAIKAAKIEADKAASDHTTAIEKNNQAMTEKFEEELKRRVDLETVKAQADVARLELELEKTQNREKELKRENDSLNETINALLNQDKKKK